MPPRPPASDDLPGWETLRTTLAARLQALDNGATITVDAPDLARPTAPRGGVVGRLLGAPHVMLAPWVTLRRQDDHLSGQTLRGGATRGRFPMSPDEAATISGLGWHATRDEESRNFVRWWPDDVAADPFLPLPIARQAALDTLRLLREVYGATPEQVGIG